jgi:hypothetical protein
MTALVHGQHARQPGLITFLRWLVACLETYLLGATGGRHESHQDAPRAEFGADAQDATDLAEMRVEMAAHDREMLMPNEPIPAVDVTETGFEPVHGVLPAEVTRSFTDAERLEYDATYVDTLDLLRQYRIDATEIALTAAVRQAGGAP